eukprot:2022167-Rhodomonas_salina.1
MCLVRQRSGVGSNLSFSWFQQCYPGILVLALSVTTKQTALSAALSKDANSYPGYPKWKDRFSWFQQCYSGIGIKTCYL